MLVHECGCEEDPSVYEDHACRYVDEHMKYWCESRCFFGSGDYSFSVEQCGDGTRSLHFNSYDELLNFYNFLGEVLDNYDVEE